MDELQDRTSGYPQELIGGHPLAKKPDARRGVRFLESVQDERASKAHAAQQREVKIPIQHPGADGEAGRMALRRQFLGVGQHQVAAEQVESAFEDLALAREVAR